MMKVLSMVGRKLSNRARSFLNSWVKVKDPFPRYCQHSVKEQVCWWTDLRDIQQLSQVGVQILESGRGCDGPYMNHELDP